MNILDEVKKGMIRNRMIDPAIRASAEKVVREVTFVAVAYEEASSLGMQQPATQEELDAFTDVLVNVVAAAFTVATFQYRAEQTLKELAGTEETTEESGPVMIPLQVIELSDADVDFLKRRGVRL